jgi:hypothetical protein
MLAVAALSSESVSMLVAGIGVLGTLLAALLTQRASQRHEERRWMREDRTRWLQQRQESYLGFLITVDRLQAGLRAVVALAEAPSDSTGTSPFFDGGVLRLEKLMDRGDELFQQLEEIKLMGSSSSVETASEVYDSIRRLNKLFPREALRELSDADLELVRSRLQASAREIAAARRAFRDTARQELGIEE